MYRVIRSSLLTTTFVLGVSTLAQAQATRTWVSGVGDDVNPCSRTAPCKTFAGAISKTAAGGEISVLDPGGYGTVTITKALTIDGDGTLGSILNSTTNGVVVNAGPSDIVILRSLSINGGGNGTNGVRYLAGGQLVIEDTTIYGSTQNGIDVALTANGNLDVRNTTITGGLSGVHVASTAGRVNVSLDRVTIRKTGTGIDGTFANGFIAVSNSVITENTTYGVFAEAGEISVENSMLTFNGIAFQSQTGATVRVSNCALYNNLTGFGCGGGTLTSAGNNRKGGNSGGGAACAPTGPITVQ